MNNIMTLTLEAIEEVNECFETRGQDVFNKVYKMRVRRLREFETSMVNDIHRVRHLGFISKDECETLIEEVKDAIKEALSHNSEVHATRVGEREYDILWLMDSDRLSREDAEERYEYLMSL